MKKQKQTITAGKEKWTKSVVVTSDYLTISQAAKKIGISQATLRNWIKQKVTTAAQINNRLYIATNEINALQNSLKNGSLKKLTKGANKSAATTFNVLRNFRKAEQTLLKKIVPHVELDKLSILSTLYLLALNISHANQLIELTSQPPFFNKNTTSPTQLINLLNEFYYELPEEQLGNIADHKLKLLLLPYKKTNDILGIVYQYLFAVKNKIASGSYYTPLHIVQEIANTYSQNKPLALDPCCGSGRFLLALAQAGVPPTHLYGADADPIAVKIAKFNLLIFFKDQQFKPNIIWTNTLTDIKQNGPLSKTSQQINGFDIILSNPPWGKCVNQKRITEDPFSHFIKAGHKLLRENGTLSYILPESILNVATHKKIRQFILDKMEVTAVHQLGRAFKDVFSAAIRMDIIKRKHTNTHITFISNRSTKKTAIKNIKHTPEYRFTIGLSEQDISILDKVYAHPHTTLTDNAQWALGIVTGNNEKFLKENPAPGFEPIYKGSDIHPFYTSEPSYFIKYQPEILQQCAPEKIYRAPKKLIYRFISRHLIFTLDTSQTLTLNSANIVIPQNEIEPELLLALFNSKLYQFLFQKKFGSIKVLRSHLETLPIPFCSQQQKNTLLNIANSLNNEPQQMHKKLLLDSTLAEIFQLSSHEIAYINTQLPLQK